MALSAKTRPHFTAIAAFISSLDKEAIAIFREVLPVCDEMGLIGKEMFAIDGCKLPSNASKEWSGTRADFERKTAKMEKAIEAMVKRHHLDDLSQTEEEIATREKQYLESLRKRLGKIRNWLGAHDDRPGKTASRSRAI